MVDQRVPKLRKDDDVAKFTALIEQNRWLVEPDAVVCCTRPSNAKYGSTMTMRCLRGM